MVKIINFGSLNIDYVYDVDHILIPGETSSSFNMQVYAGGKGLNQSVAVSKAQAHIYHAGAIGSKDSEVLIQTLEQNRINTQFLQKRDCSSGHTIIQVDKKGQNSILLFGGANKTLDAKQIEQTLSHFNSGDYLVIQNETNHIKYLLEEGYKQGLKVCFNVSPFDPSLLKLPLDLCDFLIVNEIEGAALVNLNSDISAQDLIDALSQKYQKSNILLTLGTRGSCLKLLGKEPIYQSCFKVKALDTTAAGDTFLGFFIALIAQNITPQKALQIASAASAIAVTRKGATTSIPSLKEVEDFLLNYND